jgi:hypothetical protein
MAFWRNIRHDDPSGSPNFDHPPRTGANLKQGREDHMDVRADGGSVIAKQFRTAVNPSMDAAATTSLFLTLRNLSFDHASTVQTAHEVCAPPATLSAIAPRRHAVQRDDVAPRVSHTTSSAGRGSNHDERVVLRGTNPYPFLGSSKTGSFCRRLQGRIHAVPRNGYALVLRQILNSNTNGVCRDAP